ncbi:helix-turn-helix transcriptional regulator [Streptomyces sp. NPDC007851]|uniref:helix-turn-helix transcriptional regulator n=1 Tax=Streptomyces sp. NPDC007851 TaxID=3155008 RepID=UPI00340AD1DA
MARLSPRFHMLVLACEALTAPDDAALDLFERALTLVEPADRPFDIARAQEQLRLASKTFEELGAAPWAARAMAELRACGHATAAVPRQGRGALTAQEWQIASLAASGLTNKQIAERLFLSHRTIGTHLYQIYPKLGIGSRAALPDALAALQPEETGPGRPVR